MYDLLYSGIELLSFWMCQVRFYVLSFRVLLWYRTSRVHCTRVDLNGVDFSGKGRQHKSQDGLTPSHDATYESWTPRPPTNLPRGPCVEATFSSTSHTTEGGRGVRGGRRITGWKEQRGKGGKERREIRVLATPRGADREIVYPWMTSISENRRTWTLRTVRNAVWEFVGDTSRDEKS